jgi:hypothetical protein
LTAYFVTIAPRNDGGIRHCEPFDWRSRQAKVKQSVVIIGRLLQSFLLRNDVDVSSLRMQRSEMKQSATKITDYFSRSSFVMTVVLQFVFYYQNGGDEEDSSLFTYNFSLNSPFRG